MSEGATRLFVLRHGEVHADDCQVLYGQADVRLSELGKEQSRMAAQALRREKLAAVYTSDLARALYLGQQIAQVRGLHPQLSDQLRERYFGIWQSRPWQAIQQEFPEDYRRYMESRVTMRVPGGAENFQDVQRRVIPFVREVVARHTGQSICITAHGGPIRTIVSDALRLPLEHIFTFELDYCSLCIIDYRRDGTARVLLMNGTEHLRSRNGSAESSRSMLLPR